MMHNGQTIPDLFELVAQCENRARIQQDLDQLAEFWINGPKDEEDDGAFSDPVYDHFTHKELGIPE